MLRLVLPLLMISATALGDEGRKATDAEIQRAHELFAGSWDFLSITDNGDDLGAGLVAAKLAKGGRLDVSDRTMSIISPESGDVRAATFLVDPAKNPRQIDLITKKDRVIRGIYQFQQEGLTICLQPLQDKARPTDFSAKEGSGQLLLKLKLSAQPTLTPKGAVSQPVKLDELPIVGDKPETRDEGGPTEAELRRAHEMLAGAWNILSIVDDGETLGANLVRAKFAENGRLRIGNRTMSVVSPATEERRVASLRLDPSKTPSQIDVTTQFDEILKGIYKFDGDQLWLCLAKRGDEARPTDFESSSGAGRVLFQLKMVKPEPPVERRPTFAERARERDEQIRQKLLGSWSYLDSKGRLTVVFQADGNFVATRTWSHGLKRLFEGDSTTSMGRWTYRSGVLDATVSTTQDPKLVGRLFGVWLESVGDDTLVIKNVFGEIKTARRLR